jgi:hypothetical protein
MSYPKPVVGHLGPVIVTDTGSHDLDPPPAPPKATTTCPTIIRKRGSQKLEMKIKSGDAFMMAIVAVVSSSDAFIPASATTGWSSIPSHQTTACSSTTTSENQEVGIYLALIAVFSRMELSAIVCFSLSDVITLRCILLPHGHSGTWIYTKSIVSCLSLVPH